VSNRAEPITLQELQAQLVSHEQRREIRDGGSHSSANIAAKGGRGGGPSFNNNRGGGRHGGGGRGGYGRGRNGGRGRGERGRNFLHGVFCQICGIEGHGADRCFKRFDALVMGPP